MTARHISIGPALALTVAALSVTLPRSAEAQQLETIFADANAAFFANDFDRAVAGYERLVESGVDDADVAFNLATAHARAGRHGHAIRWYERTLSLSPGDEDAERALAEVRRALGRRQAQRDGEALVETHPPFLESLVRRFSEPLLASSVLVLDALFFGLLLAFVRARGETAKLGFGIAAPVSLVLFLLATVGLAAKVGAFTEGAPAVVLVDDAPLREGPDPRAGTRAVAREGERAHVVDRDGAFVHVELAGGRNGWALADEIGEI
jgi:tetratricopeptide (TPR) repeat protein